MGKDASLACPSSGNSVWSEDCLVANVFTTYLPKPDSSAAPVLRPVMLWIHGGGFTSGSGLDPKWSGGQLASRSDVVVVAPNYRLGYLGFAAFDQTFAGNYGLADIVTALQWVKQNIKSFGGDPENVTIFGQSAGANIVAALLASPKAQGLFHAAVVQSGWPLDSYTAKPSVSDVASTTIASAASAGCRSGNVASVVNCLRGKSASAFLNLQSTKLLVDGKYVINRQLDVKAPGQATGFVNRVPLMMGSMREELGSLGTVPKTGLSLQNSLAAAGVSAANINTVLSNPSIFPVPNTSNGIQNLSV